MKQFYRKAVSAVAFVLLGLIHIGFVQANIGNSLLLTGFSENEITGRMGVYDSNPLDEDQGIKMSIVGEDALGKPGGKALRLDYDVDSWKQAKVQFWIELEQKDLSAFDTLHFYMRGDSEKGCTKNVMVRFMDGDNRVAPYIVTGIRDQWKEFEIPFKRFSRIRDWSQMKEFGIVFDDVNSNPKEGALYVDEISVSSGIQGAK